MSDNGLTMSLTRQTLPRGWVWSTVGEVGEVNLGRQRSPKNRSAEYPTKYIRAANLTWEGIDLTEVLEMDFKPHEREVYRLRQGDVLLSEASGSADQVGKPAVWRLEEGEYCFQNTVIRFRSQEIIPDFAKFVFSHYARNGVFARVAKGIGIHHLGADRLSAIPFPVPPVAEQHRIVAKVEQLLSDLDAAVAALERVRVKLKRYRASVLKAAIEGKLTEEWRARHPRTEPATILLDRILKERRCRWEEAQSIKFAEARMEPPKNWLGKYQEPKGPGSSGLPKVPEGWCCVSLGQLLHGIEGGKSFKCLPRKAMLDEWGVIKVSAMTWGTFLEDEQKAIPSHVNFDPSDEVKPGDLLLSRSNTAELVGATVFVEECRPRLLLSDKSLRLVACESLDQRWLHGALSSPVARRQLSRMATGTSNSMRNVSQDKIESVIIPLPPLAEQKRIVVEIEGRLSVLDQFAAQVGANLKRASRLRQSILKRAFEGRLVPQDPTDEPADKLLERGQAVRNGTTSAVTPRKGRR